MINKGTILDCQTRLLALQNASGIVELRGIRAELCGIERPSDIFRDGYIITRLGVCSEQWNDDVWRYCANVGLSAQ
jgi:hypothetical protein